MHTRPVCTLNSAIPTPTESPHPSCGSIVWVSNSTNVALSISSVFACAWFWKWTKPGNDHQFRNLFNQTGFQGTSTCTTLVQVLAHDQQNVAVLHLRGSTASPTCLLSREWSNQPGLESKTQHDRVAIWGMLPIQAEQASYRFCHAPNGARKGDSLQTLALGPGAYQGA